MTIHSEHPFLQPDGDRDPVRRLRGRLGATVSLWTTGEGSGRSGLTVSSYAVANGDPGHLLALLDSDSDFYPALLSRRTVVVQLLEWQHRDLADAFAGMAPAPGGVFRMGEWSTTAWGPLLSGVGAWAGVRLADEPRAVGWSMLVDTVIEHVEFATGQAPLVHRRGRYQRPS
ncbi:MAG: flavin reductase [Propionibacteriales bacterium]|nr:flavin reductase [Propionibacteriales bacterium]